MFPIVSVSVFFFFSFNSLKRIFLGTIFCSCKVNFVIPRNIPLLFTRDTEMSSGNLKISPKYSKWKYFFIFILKFKILFKSNKCQHSLIFILKLLCPFNFSYFIFYFIFLHSLFKEGYSGCIQALYRQSFWGELNI